MRKIENISKFITILGLVYFIVTPFMGIFMDVSPLELWQTKVYYSLRGLGFMIIGFVLPKILSR